MPQNAQGECKCLDLSKLNPLFKKYTDETKGALVSVLQEAQEIYRYLPEQVLEAIADHLKIPISQIYGVATFYSQFHLKPRGKHILKVCQGTACHVRGASKILETVKEDLDLKSPGQITTDDLQFTIETVACIGACGLAPVIMVDQDTHGRLNPDNISKVLSSYKK